MPVLPVLDLQQGRIVRGVAGRRHEYRPIVSTLTRSSAPLDVARALAERFGLRDFYLADLDAIGGAGPARATYDRLHDAGFGLRVDAGVRTAEDARALAAMGLSAVVIGLETVLGPEVLAQACAAPGPARLIFSLDLKDGRPIPPPGRWRAADALGVAAEAIAHGVTRLLVLDLARVGVGAGVGTEELCARLRREHAALEITAGGGVRDVGDVRRLEACGVDYVLVASALHDGRLTRDDINPPAG